MRSLLAFGYIVLNLSLGIIPITFLSIIKLLVPLKSVRSACYALMVQVYRFCVWLDVVLLKYLLGIHIQVSGLKDVSTDKWYLIVANHRSWADTLIVQNIFNYKMPILKFVVKQELAFLPLVGLICWAYGFPFVKRYSRSYLKQHPEKWGEDQQRLIRACQAFKTAPSSVINFAEGTRFSADKQKRQNSPYKHLLLPKKRGIAIILEALESHLAEVLDVTIIYDQPNLTFWQFLGGRCKKVTVIIKHVPLTDILGNGVSEEQTYLSLTETWLHKVWLHKDALIEELANSSTGYK